MACRGLNFFSMILGFLSNAPALTSLRAGDNDIGQKLHVTVSRPSFPRAPIITTLNIGSLQWGRHEPCRGVCRTFSATSIGLALEQGGMRV